MQDQRDIDVLLRQGTHSNRKLFSIQKFSILSLHMQTDILIFISIIPDAQP